MIWIVVAVVLLARASPAGATNLALGKPATQRDDHPSGRWPASKSTDGNRDSEIRNDHCSHTNDGAGPTWWTVDLEGTYSIDRVTIYNRMDCCNDRLTDTRVLVSSDGALSGPTVVECGYIGAEGTEAEVIVNCADASVGRYVTLVSANPSQVLNICEVEVFANNLALGKPASQRDDHPSGRWPASKSTDGNRDSEIRNDHCSHTNDGAGPTWWTVDLEGTYSIETVTVYNREDCCQDRLTDTRVLVSTNGELSGDGVVECGYIGAEGNQGVVTVNCADAPVGRYVTLVRDENAHEAAVLNICEVEVFGSPQGGAGGDCDAVADLQDRIDELEASLGATQTGLDSCREEVAQLQDDLLEATDTPDPVIPTASPTATLSDTARKFRLPLNGIEYILETTPRHVALDADDFCEQYGMKLAQIENVETMAALTVQFQSIQNSGVALTEVATGERTSVNLDRDVLTENFNAAGWSCVTVVPDGDSFKLVSKKCQGERAILCAAVPLYC